MKNIEVSTRHILKKEIESIPVLDKGYIKLVDYMGDDNAIVNAARVSYGNGTTKKSTDTNLIYFLMRHKHSTPFEMCEIKFEVKLPISVMRQWIRHRTANVNEISGRYSILNNEFYIPSRDRFKKQSKTNKQNSDFGSEFEQGGLDIIEYEFKESCENSFKTYESLLKKEVSRETVRGVLPVDTYTKMIWKCDLRNIFNFCSLRNASNAQWEIQQYAIQMEAIIKELYPTSMDAYHRYNKGNVNFYEYEIDYIQKLIHSYKPDVNTLNFKSDSEKLEFKEKLKKLSVDL